MKKLLLLCLLGLSSFSLPGADFYGGGVTYGTTAGTAAQGNDTRFPRINVKDPAYGAKGDARKVTDAVLNGTTTVTSATAAFVAGDVGKVVWGVETSSGIARLPIGTISTVNSATSITCSTTAAGTYSNINLVFGTDDSDAIRAARVAADAASPKGRVILPPGGYVFSKLLFDLTYSSGTDSLSISGAGTKATFLYPSPSYDFSTTTTNKSMLIRDSNVNGCSISGFTLDGSSYGFSGTNYYGLAIPGATLVVDVAVKNMAGLSQGIVIASSSVTAINLKAINCQNGGIYVNGGGVDFYSCYSGNNVNGFSVKINAVGGTSNTGQHVHWSGGIIDESTSGGATLIASTDVTFSGAILFGPDAQFACTVDGTSAAKFVVTQLVPFGAANNRSGLKVLSGGVATLLGSRAGSTGTGVALNNSGTVYDLGGNTIGTVTGTNPVSSSGAIISGNGYFSSPPSTNTTIQSGSGGIININPGGTNTFQFNGVNLSTRSDGGYGFSSSTSTGTNDTQINRNAGGVLEINNGTPGAYRDLYLRDIKTQSIGGTLSVKSGANAKAGTFTLSSGTATVSNTGVTANSVVACTVKTSSGTLGTGTPEIVITAGTGFTATGVATDNSTYNFVILEVN